MTTNETGLAINGRQAAVLYTALEIAIASVQDVLTRNSQASKRYRPAMNIQLAEYNAEMDRLAAAFPVLAKEAK